MSLEKSIQASILKYLNGLDGCIAENVMGNAFQKGRPDINGCWKGRSFKIEVKSPDHGYKATKAQIINLKRWAKAGAICFVAYSLNDVKCVINKEGYYNGQDFEGDLYTNIFDRWGV